MSDPTFFSEIERKRPNVSSKGLLNLKTIVTQNEVLNNEYKFTSLHEIDESEEIEIKKRKKSAIFPNPNVLIEYLTKPDFKQLTTRKIITTKEDHEPEQSIIQSPSKRIVISRDKEQRNDEEHIPEKKDRRIVIPNDEEQSSINSNYNESTIISRLPLPSLLSFSSNSINEEYVTRVRQIISSWNHPEREVPTNRQIIDHSSTRRSYPQFESVPTPVQESPSLTPSDLLDCCESNQRDQSTNADYWDSFHTSVSLRETMMNISKRLTKIKNLVIVDTHCHFDLIFDRLYIKHNNLKKYFDDYKDFYPSGLSFELAIHVFWRPKHLTEKNWLNWYSKYLNDERVYGSCGIHPHWSDAWTESIIEDIERCLQHPKIVAIGEIGLDFGPKNTCNIDQQCRVFGEQLKLAVKWCKPVVIHSRDAYPKTFEIMKQYLKPDHKIHLHCFVGTITDVHLFTSYFTEIKFGFTPLLTRGNFLYLVIQQLSLTQILSETDSPYFVPEELFNLSRCAHPGMVYSVIESIAQIRQVSLDDVACQLRKNAYQIYGV